MGRVRARTRRGDNNHLPYDTSYGEINGGLRCREYRSPIGKSDCGATVELRVRVIAAVMIGQLHSRVGALLRLRGGTRHMPESFLTRVGVGKSVGN